MTDKNAQTPYLLRPADQQAIDEVTFVHQHNPNGIRHTRTLTDALGFEDMGVHLVRLVQGNDSSELHYHEEDEEFIYVISGRGTTQIADEVYDIGPGDFMAFPKNSPAHNMHNPYSEDLVYLVGGTRAPIDICNYPDKGLRQFRVHGQREWTETKNLTRGASRILHKDKTK